jgi:hypothetical protein
MSFDLPHLIAGHYNVHILHNAAKTWTKITANILVINVYKEVSSSAMTELEDFFSIFLVAEYSVRPCHSVHHLVCCCGLNT